MRWKCDQILDVQIVISRVGTTTHKNEEYLYHINNTGQVGQGVEVINKNQSRTAQRKNYTGVVGLNDDSLSTLS